MNCCDHNSDDPNGKRTHKGGHMSHMWMMALCCGVPLILLFVVSLLGASMPGLKAILLSILPFLCPIMMIGMIPMMFMHGKHDDNCHEERQNDQNKALDAPERNRLN